MKQSQSHAVHCAPVTAHCIVESFQEQFETHRSIHTCGSTHCCPTGVDITGRFGNTTGLPSCYLCAVGRYNPSANLGAASCTLECAPGYFGNTTGLTTSSCSGACPAGHACPSGSIVPAQCPAGRWSYSTADVCTACARGKYGAVAGATGPSCSGSCMAGTWAASDALTVSNCSGPCTAGYWCGAGSQSATEHMCPPGQYSLAGADSCTNCSIGRFGDSPATVDPSCSGPCDAGRFGGTSGQSTSQCSGPCLPGYRCPFGSTNATAVMCPAGRYSLGNTDVCILCDAGKYGATGGVGTANCSGLCSGGRYGSTGGMTSAACEGNCSAGYYCPPGSTSALQLSCPAGQYSLTGAGSCSACPAGRYGVCFTQSVMVIASSVT